MPISAPTFIEYARLMSTTPIPHSGVNVDNVIEDDWTKIVITAPIIRKSHGVSDSKGWHRSLLMLRWMSAVTLFPSSAFRVFTIKPSWEYYFQISSKLLILTETNKKNKARPTTIPPTVSSSKHDFMNICFSSSTQFSPKRVWKVSFGVSSFQLQS